MDISNNQDSNTTPTLGDKEVFIICGGKCSPQILNHIRNNQEAYTIGVDRGADYAFENGITPSLIIGDLDSISRESLAKAQECGVTILKYPSDKDFTDLELAIDFALSRGAKAISLTSSLSGRIDHAVGNIFLLTQEKYDSIKFSIVEDHLFGVLLRDHDTVTLHGEKDETLSIIPLSQEVGGITSRGTRWDLTNDTILWGSTRGLCNTFHETVATCSIENGRCLVFQIKSES